MLSDVFGDPATIDETAHLVGEVRLIRTVSRAEAQRTTRFVRHGRA
ncbi:hypothetical protein I545_6728 [Mycobacterium kansasii 662]|uniref:Uncharacterized protein n=1 Tax=Mycobacterium kansasii 662 TaxID=1299326 RepID=X7XY66_MYCKA|nr:hypothetical protein I545_6728 [Mycobacterium kansasii 662]